jgi:hypothetical protein
MIDCFMFGFNRHKIEISHAKTKLLKTTYIEFLKCATQ